MLTLFTALSLAALPLEIEGQLISDCRELRPECSVVRTTPVVMPKGCDIEAWRVRLLEGTDVVDLLVTRFRHQSLDSQRLSWTHSGEPGPYEVSRVAATFRIVHLTADSCAIQFDIDLTSADVKGVKTKKRTHRAVWDDGVPRSFSTEQTMRFDGAGHVTIGETTRDVGDLGVLR